MLLRIASHQRRRRAFVDRYAIAPPTWRAIGVLYVVGIVVAVVVWVVTQQ